MLGALLRRPVGERKTGFGCKNVRETYDEPDCTHDYHREKVEPT